jgi:nitrogen-specific signal transduction histidine kinase
MRGGARDVVSRARPARLGPVVAREVRARRLEVQLRRAQKMETVGALTSGIAHDFNNILSVMVSHAHFVADGLPPGDPARADLEEIIAAGERAVELTRHLMAFGQRDAVAKVVDLGHVVRGLERILRRLIGEHIELMVLPAIEPAYVRVAPVQVEQVLMNLIMNGRDAMPRGGRMTIEIGRVSIYTETAGVPPGRYVTLAVDDTGMGMDEATRRRIFEPFFTTKALGHGTGLGLAIVAGIVREARGAISVDSQPGVGSTFVIYLPAIAPSDVPSPERPEAGADLAALGGTETVLLVEDDERVRKVAGAILRRAGHTVLEAQDGDEALLVAAQHRAAIDLLITDVIMPRMSGPELAARLRALRPETRVLYLSGYPDAAILEHMPRDQEFELLAKPITPRALLLRVRALLGGQASV